jgi:protein gp37
LADGSSIEWTEATWNPVTGCTKIFVNSMSDLFQKDVPLEFIKKVFAVMNDCSQHTFQILTKRPEIAQQYASALKWTPNIWMGASVEDSRVLHRIKNLVKIPAATRVLSVEPLLGPLPRLPLKGIDRRSTRAVDSSKRARVQARTTFTMISPRWSAAMMAGSRPRPGRATQSDECCPFASKQPVGPGNHWWNVLEGMDHEAVALP